MQKRLQQLLRSRRKRGKRREEREDTTAEAEPVASLGISLYSELFANSSSQSDSSSCILLVAGKRASRSSRHHQLHNMEREQLITIINEWNINRLDLFELSQPNEVSRVTRKSSRVSLCKNIVNK